MDFIFFVRSAIRILGWIIEYICFYLIRIVYSFLQTFIINNLIFISKKLTIVDKVLQVFRLTLFKK